jgi:hypothetical protein
MQGSNLLQCPRLQAKTYSPALERQSAPWPICHRSRSVCGGIRIRVEFRPRGAGQLNRQPGLVVFAASIVLLAAVFAAYHFWPRSNTPSGPAKVTQISQWNKPMYHAKLSPDGHAVAFVSPVGGIAQVFLMLTSGGEPLQLTNDEGDKREGIFSPDGKEVYYERSLGRQEIWAVPALGGLRDGSHLVMAWSPLQMAHSFIIRSRVVPESIVWRNPD